MIDGLTGFVSSAAQGAETLYKRGIKVEGKNYIALVCVLGVVAGSAGVLGGATLSLVITDVSVVAHGLVLGLSFPLAGCLSTIIKSNIVVKSTLSALVGYVSSYVITNYLLGYSVRFFAPFMGITAFAILVTVIASITIPILVGFGILLTATSAVK